MQGLNYKPKVIVIFLNLLFGEWAIHKTASLPVTDSPELALKMFKTLRSFLVMLSWYRNGERGRDVQEESCA